MVKTIRIMMAFIGITNETGVDPSLIPERIHKKLKLQLHTDIEPQWNLKLWSYHAILIGENTFKVVSFNFWGNLIKVVVEFELNKIPGGIKENLNDKYAGYLLKKVYKVEEENQRTYQIEMRKELEIIHLTFKLDGTLISKKKKAFVL